MLVNQGWCPRHQVYYDLRCTACMAEHEERFREQQRRGEMFRYRVEMFEGVDEFEREVVEAGREGVEYCGHSAFYRPTSDRVIYTVVFRVHRTD